MKYIDSEKLKAEIEKWSDGKLTLSLLTEINSIIASLQQDHIADVSKTVESEHIADVSKMMKDAVEVSGEVGYFNQRGLSILLDKSCEKLGLEEGQKCKLIIKETVMYSLLEKHNDGTWWYHPGYTFNSPEEAEDAFKKAFWLDLSRPHKIFEHRKPLFQEFSTCTKDFKTFEFGEIVMWKDGN